MKETDFMQVGADQRQDQLLRISAKKYLLIWGYCADGNGQGYNWRKYYNHKPTTSDLRKDIHALIDKQTDGKILTGCQWNDMSVYLSEENQRNFKAAYDLAVQLNGQTLPLMFKLGEDADGTAQYYTFEDMDTFTSFYTTCIAHIQTCLQDGWTEKDSIDWSKYE